MAIFYSYASHYPRVPSEHHWLSASQPSSSGPYMTSCLQFARYGFVPKTRDPGNPKCKRDHDVPRMATIYHNLGFDGIWGISRSWTYPYQPASTAEPFTIRGAVRIVNCSAVERAYLQCYGSKSDSALHGRGGTAPCSKNELQWGLPLFHRMVRSMGSCLSSEDSPQTHQKKTKPKTGHGEKASSKATSGLIFRYFQDISCLAGRKTPSRKRKPLQHFPFNAVTNILPVSSHLSDPPGFPGGPGVAHLSHPESLSGWWLVV